MSYYVGPYNNLPKTNNRIAKTFYYYKNGLRWWDGKQLRNKAKEKEYNKEHYQENKANIKEKNDKPEKKAKRKEYNKEYRDKPENKERRSKKHKDRMKNDLPYRITRCLRDRHLVGLKSHNVEQTIDVLELLECSVESLIIHLESKFEEGMTWKNYGSGSDCWQMDHRRCFKSFRLKDIEEQRKCCHWTNLQPMWKPENLAKGSKFDEATFEYKWIDKKTGWIKK
jgi:hypothetical protein